MTRVQMRTWLRRRLNETTPDQWADASLNDYLNEGLHFMQQEIEKLDTEAFIYEDCCDLVAGATGRLYAWPSNMKREIKVEIDYNGNGTYDVWERVPDRKTDTPDDDQSRTYSHHGRYMRLQGTPTLGVTDGIWIEYVPTLVMGADADVPNIPLDLHMGIVLMAQLVAFGDASGASDKEEVRKELADVIIRLPLHYVKSGGEPDRFTVGDHYRMEPGDMD